MANTTRFDPFSTNLNDLFERMTNEELEAYAQDGTLPRWFESAAGAATVEGSQA